jgi:hypothetical protein
MIKTKTASGIMEVINHGTNRIDLTNNILLQMGYPTEFHFKEDGARNDKPSIVIIIRTGFTDIAGEMSLNTLNECLNEVGYKIIEK